MTKVTIKADQLHQFNSTNSFNCLLQLFKKTPLLGCEIPWQLDANRRVEITSLIGMIDGRHPVTLQTKHLTVLRSWRDLQPQRLAGKGIDLRFTP